MAVLWYVAFLEKTDVSEAIALMMEAVSTCETLVTFYDTARCNVLEDIHLHTISGGVFERKKLPEKL
jgi:hypothetical protein